MQGLERVPDAIEPLVGYRAWFFTNNVHGASLLSLGGSNTAWEGANRHWVSAACPFGSTERESASMRAARLEQVVWSKLGYLPESGLDGPPHVIPGEDCSCGFYAMKTLSRVQQLSMELQSGPDLILGRVELAGKVIEHTVGYRAARAGTGNFAADPFDVLLGQSGMRTQGLVANVIGLFAQMIFMMINVAYSTFFLGKYGATPGKMACRLKVVDAEGGTISYGRAFGRSCAEILSRLICLIGYIIAAFDGQKRALHDHICSTRVVHNR